MIAAQAGYLQGAQLKYCLNFLIKHSNQLKQSNIADCFIALFAAKL